MPPAGTPSTPRTIARVIVDTPLPQLDRVFEYAIPDRLRENAVPGVRVTVPLRTAGRLAGGFLVGLAESAEFAGELSELEAVVSDARVLAPEIAELARRIADRSAGTASDVLRLAVPPRMVRVEKAWLAARHEGEAPADATDPAPPPPGIRGYGPELGQAVDRGGRIALDAVPRLARTRGGVWVGAWAITLAELAARVVASGRSAVLAVPDYRDLDQLQAALIDTVPQDAVARVDAGQSNPDRYRAFLRCLDPRPVVVIGNRSAVYAPAHRLGLIALWDDSDPLHAEPLAPYAHSRDVALVRAEQQDCALVFAGHTRSVEVQRLVELGWLSAHTPTPAVRPHVIVTAAQGDAAPSRVPQGAFRAAREGLATGPVLVQVARPGYAPVLACARCRQAARCERCDGPLGLGSAMSPPTCRWCGAIAADWTCAHCGGTRIRLVTRGGARTAEELGRAFPGVRVVLSDGERRVTEVDDRPALVVATRGAEPVPAGGYRAVLLLDGDRMLARESLNVGDDCLRWWSNAGALAAPGAPVVLAGVAGPLSQALATWRQPDYASAQLADRRVLRFPPAVRIATITGLPRAVADAVSALEPGSFIDVLGPTPLDQAARPRQGTADPEAVRAIVRFEYGSGAAVAAALKSAVVRAATSGRKPRSDRGYRPAPTLRVRLDDPEIS